MNCKYKKTSEEKTMRFYIFHSNNTYFEILVIIGVKLGTIKIKNCYINRAPWAQIHPQCF